MINNNIYKCMYGEWRVLYGLLKSCIFREVYIDFIDFIERNVF